MLEGTDRTLAPFAIRLGYHDARPWHMLPNVESQ